MIQTRPQGSESAVAAPNRRPPVLDWQRYLLRRLLERLGNPAIRIELHDGRIVDPGAESPVACVRFCTRRSLIRTLRDPEVAFGDHYCSGEIEIDHLRPFLDELFRRARSAPRRRIPLLQRHSPAVSRSNVQRHYDIGNEFYRLWLDERMIYTCAYFAEPGMTLEEAQLAKMDHVCRKLRLDRGESVVEAGCGWGALALHMADRYGVRVRAFNLSHEQVAHAREAARRAGLEDRVEFIEDDYRNVSGRYDAFVSVGMLEHVGIENYRALGALIDRSLTARGRGLIHTIGRHKPLSFSPWIQSRVFPGAEPPALSEMMQVFEPNDLCVLDVENLRLHYARTLEHWLARFERAADAVRARFDESFVRLWRLYLASSAAAFSAGSYQLFQVLFNRHASNDVPWTRAHLYERASRGKSSWNERT